MHVAADVSDYGFSQPFESKARLLIVDDSPVDLLRARTLAQKLGYSVVTASNGVEALEMVRSQAPNLVLADLQMPEMNGLELVQEMRSGYPSIPVVIFTSKGSEEEAVKALKCGAAHYVTKRKLADDLPGVLETVLHAAEMDRGRQKLLRCLIRAEHQFCLVNDPRLIAPLVQFFQESMAAMELCNENTRIRVGIALEEALCNALYHGNLEVSSELRQGDDTPYRQLIAHRLQESPYRERMIHVQASLTRQEARFVIRDEGPGFDPASLPDPTDPENLELASGRGLLLIRSFMDEVSHNATGNEITMIKRPEKKLP
ncbi:MAG: ATP-binding protein [Gemmatales bacterium]|nr:ATP-binding protein [Gemmatales bacterium]MDW8385659.1 ATP-binding protein [Gemmatales bacterium]